MKDSKIIKENQKWIDQTWKKLDEKLSRVTVKSRDKLPYTTINGTHNDMKNTVWHWTNGFWGGLSWLMFVGTGNEEYKKTALRAEQLLDKAFLSMHESHHDVGFMWHILSGVNYKLTGDASSKNRNLIMAMSLASRYNCEGDFIRCWNSWLSGEDVSGWTIIDCMMNIPLLYWASRETGDERFKWIAMRHADMTIRDHLRSDGSVNHIVIHDTTTPKVLGVKAGQGYSENSSWARGTAWGLYGFVLSYIHTGEKRYLDSAKKIADFFIKETKKTKWLPRLDFFQPEKPVYYDSTAGAIASCGLIELYKILKEQGEVYLNSALNILKAMEIEWCDWSDDEDGVLQMGSLMYTAERHTHIIYGDYFFAEALLKLKGIDFLPW